MAPFTKVKSTVATGPVGEQIKAAGGPEALKHLLGSGQPLQLPTFRPTGESGLPPPLSSPAESLPADGGFPKPLTTKPPTPE